MFKDWKAGPCECCDTPMCVATFRGVPIGRIWNAHIGTHVYQRVHIGGLNTHYGARFFATVHYEMRLHVEHYGTEVYQNSSVTCNNWVYRYSTFQFVV